jgi:hypothetical protein
MNKRERKSPISELPELPVTDDSEIVGTPSQQLLISGDQLIDRFSFTHFVEMIKFEYPRWAQRVLVENMIMVVLI